MSYPVASGDPEVSELAELDGQLLLAMTAVMADVFHFDPMYAWLFPDEHHRPARLRAVFELDVHHRLNGTATPVLIGETAIGFWHPPGSGRLQRPAAPRLAPSYIMSGVQHPLRAAKVLRKVLARRPEDPHWYLSHLAVQVGRQRAGLGRRLLEFGTERADEDGVGVYLETTNPEDLAFYAAAGFGQVGMVRVPEAPPVWLLWRPPNR